MKGLAASLFFTPFFFMIMSENPLPRPLLGLFTPKNGVLGAWLGWFMPKNGVPGVLLHGFTPKFRVLAPILNVAVLAICLTACSG